MSFDEKLFDYFYRFIKTKRYENSIKKNPSLFLNGYITQSQILVSALCESKIEIRESDSWGGIKGSILFLPCEINFFTTIEDQFKYLEWRLVAASVEWRKNNIKSTELLNKKRVSVANVIEEFPKFEEYYEHLNKKIIGINSKYAEQELNNLFWFGEPYEEDSVLKSVAKNKLKTLNQEICKNSFSNGTEIQGKSKDKAQIKEVSDKPDSPLNHVFEKVLTAEDYQGGDRKMDGSDQALDHQEALNELTLSHVIRTTQSSDSIFKTNSIVEVSGIDYDLDSTDKKEKEQIYLYSEWFEKYKTYKKNWCTVIESQFLSTKEKLPYDKKTAFDLKARLESCFNAYQWKSRQKEGSEIDLSLAIDRYVQSKTGGDSFDNVFMRKLKRNHDFAIQILVDCSLSSESYANQRRIIDTSKEALNIFSEAFNEIQDSISIATFSSHTRNKIKFQVLKEFNEDWIGVPEKISAITPEGYTRIGPAIRHSTFRLEKLKAKKKMTIILSDAKPTDYDYYEGFHGIADVQRSVFEAHASGVRIKVLTLADKKLSHQNLIFGSQNCTLLKDVKQLSESLFDFWFNQVSQQ